MKAATAAAALPHSSAMSVVHSPPPTHPTLPFPLSLPYVQRQTYSIMLSAVAVIAEDLVHRRRNLIRCPQLALFLHLHRQDKQKASARWNRAWHDDL